MAVDPWTITPWEQARYDEQFQSLQPQSGIVTGVQAKGFLLQSQLPPAVLGHIWSLSDADADGKMDIKEFSIACKLINLKLRGFEIPKVLPSPLLQSFKTKNSVGNIPPIIPPLPAKMMKTVTPLRQSSSIQGQTLDMFGSSMAPIVPIQHVSVAAAPATSPSVPPVPAMSLVPSNMTDLSVLAGGGIVPTVHSNDPMPLKQLMSSHMLPLSPLETYTMPMVASPPLSLVQPNKSLISGSPLERKGSFDSPLLQLEWAVPHQTKLKYTQLFNTMDRARTGFLSGPQARNIMVQTKLSQKVLADIWSLSDMDNDGKLGCEEFVLAMYLCDQALLGERVPLSLSADLIPPSFRRSLLVQNPSLTGAIISGSTGSSLDGDTVNPASTLVSQTSFEDKRKENFEKGQAELERRRKALADIQRKEQEERERKEREEIEKREKARLEQERRRQQEIDWQLQQQKEIENEKEEQRKRQQEQREAARKEMERQRQLEWEKQKLQDLQLQRQKEQDNVLRLKAQNQSLSIELSTLTEKVKELSQKICDTRVGVSNVKTTIDGMRSTRDSQVQEMALHKNRLKEQNSRLIILSQEKVRLETKNKLNMALDSANQEQVNVAFSNKHIVLKQLHDKYEDTRKHIDSKMSDIKNNNSQLSDLKTHLGTLVQQCETLYEVYDGYRQKLHDMRTNYNSNWDTDSTWDNKPAVPASSQSWPSATASVGGMVKYRAVYEFVARNQDEISFQPGDIVMVPLKQNSEPGWLAGEIRGHTGWFPESYVELADTSSSPQAITQQDVDDQLAKTYLEGIAEVPENIADVQSEMSPVVQAKTDPAETPPFGEIYVACFPYQSTEQGDLTFNAGEVVTVTRKEGDWWTGAIGDRMGIFPSNYVQKSPMGGATFDETSHDTSTPVTSLTNVDYAINKTTPTTDTKAETIAISQIDEDIAATTPVDFEISEINEQAATHEQPLSMISAGTTPDFAALAANNQSIRSKKPEIAQVIAPYESTSSEQLSLQRGQLIMIRKKTEIGWWEGELQAKGRRRQVGWFPASYVKLLVGGRNSGRNTPVSASKTDMMEQVLDKVIALYSYTAQNEDELSFEKDDIISVTGRAEPAWWSGERNGISGLFPSNYVGPLTGNH